MKLLLYFLNNGIIVQYEEDMLLFYPVCKRITNQLM